MEPILKLLLFLVFLAAAGVAGYKVYQFFNNKVRASNTWLEVIGYTLLLILANVVLFFGGLYLLVRVYAWVAG
jgi:hypothetical protein